VNLSSWNNSRPVSYSGFGLGANETPLPYMLSSTNQASYLIYLSAKVGGTSAGVTNIPASMDLNFFTQAGQQIYDLTSPLMLSTDWQSYVFDGGTNLQVATWLAGAQSLFNQNVTNVNKLEVQITVPGSPDVGALSGYDNNNTVNIGSIKVVQLVPDLAPLTIIQTNGQTIVTWTNPDPSVGGTAKLQSATKVAGPYLDVAGAASATASPYMVSPDSDQKLYRIIWVPSSVR
jgi:hypothetical protein